MAVIIREFIVNNFYIHVSIRVVFLFLNDKISEGDNVYRILMVMKDGTKQVSEFKSVRYDGSNGVRLFPNPATNTVDIDLSQYQGLDVSIYMYNALGKQVNFKLLPNVGVQPIKIDLDGFTNGTYVVRFAVKGKKDVIKKLMISK